MSHPMFLLRRTRKSGVPTPETRFSIISVLSGGQTQDEVGSGILSFFFLGADQQRFWLGFEIEIEIEISTASRFSYRSHVSSAVPASAGVSEGFSLWTLLTLRALALTSVPDFQFIRMPWT